MLKNYKKQLQFHLLLNIAIGVFISFSSYYHLRLYNVSDYVSYFIHFLVLQFSVFGFIYFISLNKYIFRIVFPIFFIPLALFAYWVYTQDMSVTPSIIQAVIETKPDIALDLLSIPFTFFIIIIFIITFHLVKYHKSIINNKFKSPLTILAIIAIASYFFIDNYRCCTLRRRLPYSAFYGLTDYFKKPNTKLLEIPNKLSSKSDSLNIIFVLGESVRADHIQINGYKRSTTPLLNSRKNLISYSNIYTPYTYTAVSVPRILTNASINDSIVNNVYSIYTILNKINYQTTWIGNQTPEKSYELFIYQNDVVELIDKYHSSLSFNKELDIAMLPFVKKTYNSNKQQFITIHMIGSHWWYESRYTKAFRKFKPVIKTKHIPSISQEEMINSYDNSILYLDYFLNSIINTIDKSNANTLMIYLSDHGELLGENGKFLHGQETKASMNPAMFIWYSDKFKTKHPKWVERMKQKRNDKISTDFFYYSILDLLQINGMNIDKKLSIIE